MGLKVYSIELTRLYVDESYYHLLMLWTIGVVLPARGQWYPDSKVYGANMGPSGAAGTHAGPMLAPWIFLSGYT